MKTCFILLVVAIIGAAASLIGWHFGAAVHPSPVSASAGVTALAKVHPISRPAAPLPQSVLSAPAAAPESGELNGAETSVASSLDQLTARNLSFGERQALWEKLGKAGQLDAAIVSLKQLALANPVDPMVSLALAEAEVNQLRVISQKGADFNEKGILALQANQDFSAALAQDPTNWAAQFEKAQALSYWPPSLGKGPEVVSMLTALVAQQQTMTPQPEFAQTYVTLGKAYQAAGQADLAQQTWQQGLAQYPLNAGLLRAVGQAANP